MWFLILITIIMIAIIVMQLKLSIVRTKWGNYFQVLAHLVTKNKEGVFLHATKNAEFYTLLNGVLELCVSQLSDEEHFAGKSKHFPFLYAVKGKCSHVFDTDMWSIPNKYGVRVATSPKKRGKHSEGWLNTAFAWKRLNYDYKENGRKLTKEILEQAANEEGWTYNLASIYSELRKVLGNVGMVAGGFAYALNNQKEYDLAKGDIDIFCQDLAEYEVVLTRLRGNGAKADHVTLSTTLNWKGFKVQVVPPKKTTTYVDLLTNFDVSICEVGYASEGILYGSQWSSELVIMATNSAPFRIKKYKEKALALELPFQMGNWESTPNIAEPSYQKEVVARIFK